MAIVCNVMYANDTIPKAKFLEEAKNHDAYYLYAYTDVSYSRFWSSYRRQVAVTNKLVVNTKNGVEKYAFLKMSEYVAKKIREFEVKTLKSDGSVVELDSSLVFKKNTKGVKQEAIDYPIPGVEPGDTIYTSYVYSESVDSDELLDYVNLYAEVPNLNAEYTVKTPPDLYVHYKQYNGFPEPKVLVNDTLIYCAFKMEQVEAIEANANMCVQCELPYLYYSLEKEDSEARTWKDVYNEEFNIITQPFAVDFEKKGYYRTWKRNVLGEAKDSSKFHQFRLLHRDILENMTMEEVNAEELIKSSGYFLKNNRIDPLSIKRLYRQILEDLEISYSAVFARSKRGGAIDPYYIRRGEYDHVFFAMINEKGGIDLLYPHDLHIKYQINEIPTSLYKTQAIAVKPYLEDRLKRKQKFIDRDLKLSKVDSVIVNAIRLPGMSSEYNQIRQILYRKIDPENELTNSDGKAVFDYRFSVSGGMSTDLRDFYGQLDKNEELEEFYGALAKYEESGSSIEMDSVISMSFKAEKPFNYSITAKVTAGETLRKLRDSVYSMTLDKLISHAMVESYQDAIKLNYYLDYGYTDKAVIMLEFPYPVEVSGIEKVDLQNDFGSYFFDLQVTGNKLQVISNYSINKSLIPKEEYGQLKALNAQVNKAMESRFLIKPAAESEMKKKNVVDKLTKNEENMMNTSNN